MLSHCAVKLFRGRTLRTVSAFRTRPTFTRGTLAALATTLAHLCTHRRHLSLVDEAIAVRIQPAKHALHTFGQFIFGQFAVSILVVLHHAGGKVSATLAWLTLSGSSGRTAATETSTPAACGTQFLCGKFAIVILVQLLERHGRILQFRFIDRAVAIGIQRRDHRIGHRTETLPLALTTGCTRSALRTLSFGALALLAAFRTGTAGTFRTLAALVLC
ncbi:MAG: hypothetical protein K0Q55_2467 [Verrucomicrobia bacterium]|nr:hypothetical protein [Verrucomicrobiota bacterium]